MTAEEAGPVKTFDLSRTAMAQRWRAGRLDMQQAGQAGTTKGGIRVVRRLMTTKSEAAPAMVSG